MLPCLSLSLSLPFYTLREGSVTIVEEEKVDDVYEGRWSCSTPLTSLPPSRPFTCSHDLTDSPCSKGLRAVCGGAEIRTSFRHWPRWRAYIGVGSIVPPVVVILTSRIGQHTYRLVRSYPYIHWFAMPRRSYPTRNIIRIPIRVEWKLIVDLDLICMEVEQNRNNPHSSPCCDDYRNDRVVRI